VDQLVLDVPIQQPWVFAQVEGIRLLATHGHLQTPEALGPLCEKWGVHFLFTGHLHVPVVVHHGRYTHINPGTPTYPLDPDAGKRRPTCAFIQNTEVGLVDLGTGERL